MRLQVLGIDLGKTCFHLVGLDSTGRAVVRKRCSRTPTVGLHREFAGAVDWHGGLQWSPLSRAGAARTRS
jgi:hypothetical protein